MKKIKKIPECFRIAGNPNSGKSKAMELIQLFYIEHGYWPKIVTSTQIKPS